jgi:hypothetical protein
MHLVDKFLLFEEKNSLFTEKIMGFSFWHYVRFEVFFKIVRQRENYQIAHKSLSDEKPITVLLLFLKQLKFFVAKSSIWNLTKKEILIINHPRRVKNGDYFDCIYTDAYLSQTHHSYYVFELPYEGRHFVPTRTENLRYLDRVYFATALYQRIVRKMFGSTLKPNDVKKITEIANSINLVFGVNLPRDEFIKLVEIAIIKHKSYLRYFERVLKKVKPKLILEVVSYMDPNFAINQLAKEKGIPTVEIQHGTMGKYHIAYNFPKGIQLDSFPDYVFSFGKYWIYTTRLPIDPTNVKAVGWPYYEKKVERYKGSAPIDKRKAILFISQPTIGEELSTLAIKLNKILDQTGYRIIYKLHPSEFSTWKEKYPWLIEKDIDVADSPLLDVHHYLSSAFVQVGVSSTALFEGLGYGLNTAIFKAPFHEYMEELYNNGMACLVENENQLLVFINSCSEHKYYSVDYFWESDSMKNFNENINNIISKG